MSSDKLRSKITFSERAIVSDGIGGTQGDTWETRFTVSAQIWPRLGGETVIAARLQGTQPVTIRVRESSDTLLIDPTWRAVDARKGTVYNIRSVVDPFEHTAEHGRFRDVLCEAGVQV